ncbi:flagellar biosynthetic protein FliO [Vibrio sp. CDRSL-10 TSBA]
MKKLISLAMFSAPALAVENNQLDLATTLGSLIFVIALILAMAWMLKRMRVPAFGQQKGLSVVRQLAVGTKERVMIVQAGEEQFLIGVTAQSVQLISKLDKPLQLQETEAASFTNQLTQLLKKHDNKPSV